MKIKFWGKWRATFKSKTKGGIINVMQNHLMKHDKQDNEGGYLILKFNILA